MTWQPGNACGSDLLSSLAPEIPELILGSFELRFCCSEHHQCCFCPANNEDGKLRRGPRVQAEREGRMAIGVGKWQVMAKGHAVGPGACLRPSHTEQGLREQHF